MRFAWVIILLIVGAVWKVSGAGEFEVIGSYDPVTAQLGHDVVLPCHLEPPVNVLALTVEWKLNGTLIVNVYRSGEDNQDPLEERFKKRTSLFLDEMVHGNISLRLSNVSHDDAGNYTCQIVRQYDNKPQFKKGSVTLTVENSQRREEDPETGNNKGVVIGVTVGVICLIGLIIGLIIVILLIVRKRRLKRKQVNNPPNEGNHQELLRTNQNADDQEDVNDQEDANNQEDENEQEDENDCGEREPLNEPNRQPNDD